MTLTYWRSLAKDGSGVLAKNARLRKPRMHPLELIRSANATTNEDQNGKASIHPGVQFVK